MLSLFSNLLEAIGNIGSSFAFFIDEPECPKSLIK